MNERPIPLKAWEVRAILDGRKTQTRRVVKHVLHCPDWGSAVGRVGGAWRYGSRASLGLSERGDHWSVVLDDDHLRRMCTQEAYGWGAGSGCPYGVPGDRLWVRETARTSARHEHPPKDEGEVWVDYASGGARSFSYELDRRGEFRGFPNRTFNLDGSMRWQPSVLLPRWASRILLEVVALRVERLQEISDVDAVAEGFHWPEDDDSSNLPACPQCNGTGLYTAFDPATLSAQPNMDCRVCDTPAKRYRLLWEQTNGPGSWDVNPWVWTLTFQQI